MTPRRVLNLVKLGGPSEQGDDELIAPTGQPLYQQVADDVRSQIASGKIEVGGELPSTAKLVEQYGVSIGVVRSAVRVLQDEGILIGQPGKAVYVRATPETATAEATALKSVDQQIAELRAEVRRLADHQPSEVIAKIDALQTEVGRLQADLRTLYGRLGQPYPDTQKASKPRRHNSGA